MNSITSSIPNLSHSSTCALCNDTTTRLFGGRSVVTASCPESHPFHLDCIVQPLLDQARTETRPSKLHCLVCSEQPVLPLLRDSQPVAEHACRYGDPEALGKMLDIDIENIGWKQSGDVIYADNLKSRIAVVGQIAAKHGQVECLQLLREKSRGPNPEPDSVLCTAAANGRIECLEWILSTWFKEHDRENITKKLNLAMCSAAGEGQLESMQYLMKKGANEAAGALRLASQRCQTDSIRFLVKSWFCFEDLNSRRLTAILNECLMIASAKNQPESVQVLLNEGGLDLSLDLNYALYIAVGSGSTQCMQPLTDAGADINGRFEKGSFLKIGLTPLTSAVIRQDKKLMNAVMLAGANVNVKNQFGECAIHIAAGLDDITWLRQLLEYGANRNARDQKGRTALHLGNCTDNVACAETLIRAGADINARDCYGETALFAAARKNNIGYIMALIDANADINVKNNRNETALEFASDVQCKRALVGAGAMYSWQLELLDVAEALDDLRCTLS